MDKDKISLPWSMKTSITFSSFLGFLFGVVLLFAGICAPIENSSNWPISFMCLFMEIFVISSIRQKFDITEEGIVDSSFPWFLKKILWKEISSVEVPVITKSRMIEIYKINTKFIFLREGFITVNYDCFKTEDISIFMKFISLKAPGTMDDLARSLM